MQEKNSLVFHSLSLRTRQSIIESLSLPRLAQCDFDDGLGSGNNKTILVQQSRYDC